MVFNEFIEDTLCRYFSQEGTNL